MELFERARRELSVCTQIVRIGSTVAEMRSMGMDLASGFAAVVYPLRSDISIDLLLVLTLPLVDEVCNCIVSSKYSATLRLGMSRGLLVGWAWNSNPQEP